MPQHDDEVEGTQHTPETGPTDTPPEDMLQPVSRAAADAQTRRARASGTGAGEVGASRATATMPAGATGAGAGGDGNDKSENEDENKPVWTPDWNEEEFREWVEEKVAKKLSTKLTWLTIGTGLGVLATLVSVVGLITKWGQDYITAKNDAVKADTNAAVAVARASIDTALATDRATITQELTVHKERVSAQLSESEKELAKVVDSKIDAQVARALVFQRPVLDELNKAAKDAAVSEDVKKVMLKQAAKLAESDEIRRDISTRVCDAIATELPSKVADALADTKFQAQIVSIAETELRRTGSIQGIVREQLKHSYDMASDDFERVPPLQMLVIFEDDAKRLDTLLLSELERSDPESNECFEIALAAYRFIDDADCDGKALGATLAHLARDGSIDRPGAFVQFFERLPSQRLKELDVPLRKLDADAAIDVVLRGISRNPKPEALMLLADLATDDARSSLTSSLRNTRLESRACSTLAKADPKCWSQQHEARNDAIRKLVSRHEAMLRTWLAPERSQDFVVSLHEALKQRDVARIERLRDEARKANYHDLDMLFRALLESNIAGRGTREQVAEAAKYFESPDAIREWIQRNAFFNDDGEPSESGHAETVFNAIVRLLRLERWDSMDPDFGWRLLPIEKDDEGLWQDAELHSALWTARLQLEHEAGIDVAVACNRFVDEVTADERARFRPGYRRSLMIALALADRAYVESYLDRVAKSPGHWEAGKGTVDESLSKLLGLALSREVEIEPARPDRLITLMQSAAPRNEGEARTNLYDTVLRALVFAAHPTLAGVRGSDAELAFTEALARLQRRDADSHRLALAMVEFLLNSPADRRHALVLAVENRPEGASLVGVLPQDATNAARERALALDRRLEALLPWRGEAPSVTPCTAGNSAGPFTGSLAGDTGHYVWFEVDTPQGRAVSLRAIGTSADVSVLATDRRRSFRRLELQPGEARSLGRCPEAKVLLRVYVGATRTADCQLMIDVRDVPKPVDLAPRATEGPSIAPGGFEVEPRGDWGWVRFHGESGKSYEIRTSAWMDGDDGSMALLDTELTLRDAEGHPLHDDHGRPINSDDAVDDSPFSAIEWQCPATGDYSIGVRSLNWTPSGTPCELRLIERL